MFHCKHCNISMTGPENYKQHLEGKKHLRKLKVDAGIMPAAPPKPVQGKPGGFMSVNLHELLWCISF